MFVVQDDDIPGFEVNDQGLSPSRSQEAQQTMMSLDADVTTSQFIGDNLIAEPKKVRINN